MAKFGYTCKCGWRLNRGAGKNQKTRKQYAAAKRLHAEGNKEADPPQVGCQFLAAELRRTQRHE